MSDTGAVYDLGYAPYEGERRGRSGARRTVVADGVRRILGIRRKGRRKVLPWLLVTIAVLPPIAFVGISFFIPIDISEAFDAAEQHSQFFSLGGTIVLLFTALAAPELLIPDRRDGVLSMLSSRPMTPSDYLGARFAALVAVVGAFLLIPQLVLYIGQAGVDPDGLIPGLIDGLPNIPKVLAVAAIYTIAYVPLGFVVASLSNRKAVASGSYLVLMLALTAFAEAIVQNTTFTGGRFVALLAPINTADAANAWIFGAENPNSLLAAADLSPALGILALIVIGTLATSYSVARYRRIM
jgi:ABC-2 type transport system permease protein